MAPLEALADGALLVTVPSKGPFEALGLARELDPQLVSDPLAPAIRHAFELPADQVRGYRERAAALVERFRPEAVQRVISDELVPALLA
jgi:hypothetical protein